MLYNYDFTISAFCVLSVLLIFGFRQKYLPTSRNFYFRALVLVELVTILLDLCTAEMDYSFAKLNIGVLHLANIMYFSSFMLRPFIMFCYYRALMEERVYTNKILRVVVVIPVVLAVLIVLSTPFTELVYYFDEAGYHKGILYNILYINSFVYLGFMLISMVHHIALKFEEWQRIEVLAILVSWLTLACGYIVRMIYTSHLVMNAFYGLALLLLYLIFQNPDFYVRRKMNLFNQDATQLMLRKFNQDGEFSLFAFAINDYSENRHIHGQKKMDAGLKYFGKLLSKKYKGLFLSYIGEGRFCLMSQEKLPMEELSKYFHERIALLCGDSESRIVVSCSCATFSGTLPDTQMEGMFVDMIALALQSAEKENRVVSLNDDSIWKKVQYEAYVHRAVDLAVEANKIEVFYQPLYNTNEGRYTGAEALARLRDSGDKSGQVRYIRPDIFINVAERSGAIIALGDQIFEKVCKFIQKNDMHAMGLDRINVNLSPLQCQEKDMPERLIAIAHRYSVDMHYIKFEITESALVDDKLLISHMNKLKAEGAVFALDDFGTGYSNIVRLLTFPFDDVKLDMSFVRAYFENKNAILPAIIKGFKDAGMRVTAEGVETQEMLQGLSDMHCDLIQGYYFSKPLPEYRFKGNFTGANRRFKFKI